MVDSVLHSSICVTSVVSGETCMSLDDVIMFIREQYPEISEETAKFIAQVFLQKVQNEHLTFDNLDQMKEFLKKLFASILDMICQMIADAFKPNTPNPKEIAKIIKEILSALGGSKNESGSSI